jgi:hypothetical protein
MSDKNSSKAIHELRPADAKIPADTGITVVALSVDCIDRMLKARSLAFLTDEQIAALWCADPDDTFGMLDDLVARVGLDEKAIDSVRLALFEVLPFDAKVSAVAERFSYLVRDALHEHEVAEINRLNKTDPKAQSGSICHSHDYFDPNESMIDAVSYFGITFDASSDEQAALTNAAWSKAKVDGFGAETAEEGYTAFREAFPQVYTQQMGGGCTAWQFDLMRGETMLGSILITTPEDPIHPKPSDKTVTVGVYDLNDDVADGDYNTFTWAEAIEWLRARIARVQS